MGSGVRFMREVPSDEGAKVEEVLLQDFSGPGTFGRHYRARCFQTDLSSEPPLVVGRLGTSDP